MRVAALLLSSTYVGHQTLVAQQAGYNSRIPRGVGTLKVLRAPTPVLTCQVLCTAEYRRRYSGKKMRQAGCHFLFVSVAILIYID